MMKLMEALIMRRAWLRLARQRFQLGGVKVSGQLRICSSMKNSAQLRITLGMWQMMKTTTIQMRTVARLSSPLTALLVAFWCVYLKRSSQEVEETPLLLDPLEYSGVEEYQKSYRQDTGEDEPAPVLVISTTNLAQHY